MGRPCQRTSMLGEVERVEDEFDPAADQGGVDLVVVAVQLTVAVLVTVRHSDHRNASRSCAGRRERQRRLGDQRASGACPVSECARR